MDKSKLLLHLFFLPFLISGASGIIFFFLFGNPLELVTGFLFIGTYILFFLVVFILKGYRELGDEVPYLIFLLNYLFGEIFLLIFDEVSSFSLIYTLLIQGYAYIVSGGIFLVASRPEISGNPKSVRAPSWKYGVILGILAIVSGIFGIGLNAMQGSLFDLHFGIALIASGSVMVGITLFDGFLVFDMNLGHLIGGLMLCGLNLIVGIGFQQPYLIGFIGVIIVYAIIVHRRFPDY